MSKNDIQVILVSLMYILGSGAVILGTVFVKYTVIVSVLRFIGVSI